MCACSQWQAMAQEDVDLLVLVQRNATKTICAANLLCEKKLREMGFLAQEDSLGRPYLGLSVLKGNFKERLFTRASGDITRDNGFNLKEGIFRLNRSKNFLQ